MHLLVVSLCAATSVLIVLASGPCSMEKKREMLINICGHYRRRRSTAYNDYSYNGKGSSKNRPKTHNDLNFDSETRHQHHKQFHIVANDTTGGILIRHKRGSSENYMYCCLGFGNCTFIC